MSHIEKAVFCDTGSALARAFILIESIKDRFIYGYAQKDPMRSMSVNPLLFEQFLFQVKRKTLAS